MIVAHCKFFEKSLPENMSKVRFKNIYLSEIGADVELKK